MTTNVQSLYSLSFAALAQSANLSDDDKQKLVDLVELGVATSLVHIAELKENCEPKLAGRIAECLSNPAYVKKCINLTYLKELQETLQGFSAQNNSDYASQIEINPLIKALVVHFDKHSITDLLLMASNSDHAFNSLAQTTLKAKLASGLLEGRTKAYVEQDFPNFTDRDLVGFALNKQDLFNDLAKQLLIMKLQNNTYNDDIYRVKQLIPVLGEPARAYVIGKFHTFDNITLEAIAKNQTDEFNELAKQHLISRLNIFELKKLIPVLGDTARQYVEDKIHVFSDIDLVDFALDEKDPFNDLAKQLLIQKLATDNFEGGRFNAIRLKPVLGVVANMYEMISNKL